MNNLEQLVLNCELCLKYSKVKCKQPSNMSLGQEIPIHPWTKIAMDIFYFDGISYLLIVNYKSRFSVVRKPTSMTTQHATGQMKLVFSEYGWPENIISNNGPSYSAKSFTELMKDYIVNHITSLLHYPQSNGLVEKCIQTMKNYSIMHKKREQTCTKA